jgi:hypothetical protein
MEDCKVMVNIGTQTANDGVDGGLIQFFMRKFAKNKMSKEWEIWDLWE